MVGWPLAGVRSTVQHLAERDVVIVYVLHAKFLYAIWLDAEVVVDNRASLLELFVDGFHVVHPEVDVPHLVDDSPVRDELRVRGCLAQHHGVAVTTNHAEVGRLTPKAIVREAEPITEIVSSRCDIPDKQDWCT